MEHVTRDFHTLYEPFAGSAAISLYCAHHSRAKYFVIGDALTELIELWQLMVDTPEIASSRYERLWQEQHTFGHGHFNHVREQYNATRDPIMLLYLIARCVKNAIRFNKNGNFTQSVDKRRRGMHPDKMRKNIFGASALLRNRVEFFAGDFNECIQGASQDDLVYMDPPYQGTTYGRDKRYFDQIERDDLCAGLYYLNERDVPFLLSYDGMCGQKRYGEDLPGDLHMRRVYLTAGRSSQATLSGRHAITVESLYLSRTLQPVFDIGIRPANANRRE